MKKRPDGIHTCAELIRLFSSQKGTKKGRNQTDATEMSQAPSEAYVAAVHYPAPTEDAPTLVYFHGNADLVCIYMYT